MRPIYIDRVIEANALAFERKSVLVVMFIPSLQRDGATRVDQDHWVEEALSMFGTVFGGATAYPQAKGIWRDDERGGVTQLRSVSKIRTPCPSSARSVACWGARPSRAKLGSS
jgi:hypothetical protein